jgi:hypothetical protein
MTGETGRIWRVRSQRSAAGRARWAEPEGGTVAVMYLAVSALTALSTSSRDQGGAPCDLICWLPEHFRPGARSGAHGGACRLWQFQHVLGEPAPVHPPPASATALITANWEAFFSGKTAAAQKITLLQNGQAYAAIINAQSGSSMASSASAAVTEVTVTSPAQATVTYNVLLGTTPALTNQSGVAVYQSGSWKVGDASFCGLLALENGGKAPSVCNSAG